MKKIIIASQNPVKLKAVQHAFEKVFPADPFAFEGVNVASEVSNQPIGKDETLQGAVNRVKNAWAAQPEADYLVGIEGGIFKEGGQMVAFAWVYIKDQNGKIGKAETATFYLPPKVMQLIEQGMELGEADDVVFRKTNSKQKGGSVGILTKGIINRAEYYEQAITLALIPFMNPQLYD